jgi:hypothetical protein
MPEMNLASADGVAASLASASSRALREASLFPALNLVLHGLLRRVVDIRQLLGTAHRWRHCDRYPAIRCPDGPLLAAIYIPANGQRFFHFQIQRHKG